MLTYQQAIDFVNQNKGTKRAIIFSDGLCAACTAVENVLKVANMKYAIMDISDTQLFFKPGYCPVTYFFLEDDTCHPRYDVFDIDGMNNFFNFIQEMKNNTNK